MFSEPVVTRGPMDFDNRPRAGCSGDAPCLKDSCPECRLPGQVAAFLVSRPRLQGGFAAQERGWSKFLVGKYLLVFFKIFGWIVSKIIGWKLFSVYICNMSWIDDEKPLLRQETCWRCKWGRGNGTKCSSPGRITHVLCKKRHRWVNNFKACVCEEWESIMPAKLFYREDGIPVRNQTSLDYRTANQWEMIGRYIKEDAEGLEMHPTMNGSKTYTYYLIEDTILDPEIIQ